ncbi:MAG: LLM class flavin-dependent oxidoreductase, partial [Actinomycetota bacterium]
MDLGLMMFTGEHTISAMDLARAAEDYGFESLRFPDHTHIPTSRETPYPGGGPLPDEYIHLVDPFVALMAAAAVTTTLRIGTGMALVVERDPIIT